MTSSTPKPSRQQGQHARNPSIPAHIPHANAPTELDLSPSKARAHATTTHTWTQVINWLTQLLPANTPLPPFERNPETLAYLQTLMHANRFANHARNAVYEAQSRQLAAYAAQHEQQRQRQERDPGAALLDDVAASLTPEGNAALTDLAEACVALKYMPPAINDDADGDDIEAELGRRVLSLSASIAEAEEQLSELRELREGFEAQTAAAVQGLKEGGVTTATVGRVGVGDAEDAENETAAQDVETAAAATSTAALRKQTSQLTAQTKHLSLKTAEYRERIAVLEQSETRLGTLVGNLKQREKDAATQREIVRRLEDRLKEYHGLPPDLEASRAEVRRAQAELDLWKRKREQLFEEMGGA